MIAELDPLRRLLDERVVGHDDAKQALLLALVCREHIYLEGPPGTAKTLMAEVTAHGSSLDFFFYQFHRDTRLAELVGDVVLERRTLEEGKEQIHQRIEPGGILTAQVCVLDDISRAPGEALNVLLRILNERQFGEKDIPLLTAIATSNPYQDDYYNEPLDPANLDRFALQLRVEGLLQGGSDESARQLLERFAEPAGVDPPAPRAVVAPGVFDALHARLAGVEIPEAVLDALLELLRILIAEYECGEANSLLTDRTFLVKALKLLRGWAVLSGRERVEAGDLRILRWMTTFRVPDEVHEKIPDVVRRVAG
jgi:MoxR-like ATPase